jgi:Abnormal spindle-like microcephaly-assoc'd, ASPM-SPD-2-Hydin
MICKSFTTSLALVLAISLCAALPVDAQESIAPAFAGSYSLNNIGIPPGVPPSLGGMTFLDNNTLLVGGCAESACGAIYSIGVVRTPPVTGHITGFSGTAVQVSTAPSIDGGLAFAPNGDLLFTGWPTNTLGEIKPGSTAPDKTVTLPAKTNSVSGLQFAPNGDFKITSYNTGGFYTATLTADGTGTYNVSTVTLDSTPGGGPEGIVYVPAGSPVFTGPSLLLAQYGASTVAAFLVDSNDNPIISSAQNFVIGLGAEGAAVDPVTNDFLFSTYGGTSHIDVVGGFATVTLTPSTLNVGSVLVGSTSPSSKPITLTNTGSSAMTINAGDITASGNFTETDTTCQGQTLQPNGSCTMTVTITPSVPGAIPGAVTVKDNAADTPQVVGLTGTGLLSVSVSPASLNLGSVPVGTTSASKTMTITNNTSSLLSFAFMPSTDYSAIGSGTAPCTGSLAAKKKCTVSVSFTPSGNGVENGSLAVSGSTFATVLAALSGTGTGGAASPFTFSPPSTSFSNTMVGASSSKTVTVTNSSGAQVNITNLAASSDFGVIGNGTNPCGAGPLGPGAQCTVSASFNPSVPGSLSGEITFMYGASSTQVYDLKGTAVLPVSFTPAALTFVQTVGGSTSKSLTVNNNQSVVLNFMGTTPFVASGQYAVAPGGTTPCGSSVAAHGKCTLTVTFTPLKTGAIPGAVTISHDASGSPQSIKLSGTGQ